MANKTGRVRRYLNKYEGGGCEEPQKGQRRCEKDKDETPENWEEVGWVKGSINGFAAGVPISKSAAEHPRSMVHLVIFCCVSM